MDEQVAMMGDRVLPSPKTFVPSFLKEDEQFSFGPMRQMSSEDRDMKQGDFSFDKEMSLRSLSEHKSSSRGGLASRIAARAGFSAPRLSTESIRSKNDLSYTDKVKSPYLTISPGISPSALLESPVFIANSQASPTTGKFQLFADEIGNGLSVDTGSASKGNKFDIDSESSTFAFKPHREPTVPFSLSTAFKRSQAINPQELSGTEDSATTENAASNFGTSQAHSHESLSKLLIDIKSEDRIARSQLDAVSATADQSPPLSDQQDDREEHDQTIAVDPISGGTTGGVSAEDGYHWRKYGQKQVKGSEFPRSYYRCMHNNCPVKKKVEMSPEGIVIEVIYKGSHNHPEAAPYQASSMASSHFNNHHGRGFPGNNCGDRGSVWGTAHNGLLPGTCDWRNSSFEQNSIPLVNPEIHHPLPSEHMQNGQLDSGEAAVGSSTYSYNGGQNDFGTHGSISNDEEDESKSKRRKIETSVAELGSGATRAIREPRVVVQTRSDVDILDDGYRWRKYGQKVVKGNPNPRSYYKCTYIGCTVRKHVERASNDHSSVITTYEGKHSHDVPAARNSNHTNSPISAGFASLPQNLTPPNATSFNMPVMQTHVPPPHGFPRGMNQSSLVGFAPSSNKIFGIPAVHQHPMQPQQQPQRMNNMGFMMPRGDLNYVPNIYTSNGSSRNCHVSNMTPMRR